MKLTTAIARPRATTPASVGSSDYSKQDRTSEVMVSMHVSTRARDGDGQARVRAHARVLIHKGDDTEYVIQE